MCDETDAAQLLLPSAARSASMARDWLRVVACQLHCADQLDDAVLLVSELVTNAFVHGGPPIVLGVDCAADGLHVRVRDGSLTWPELRRPRVDEDGGRGVLLVDQIAGSWGVADVTDEHGTGKQVWFTLPST